MVEEEGDLAFIKRQLNAGRIGFICSYAYPGTDYSREEIDNLTADLQSKLESEGYNYRRSGGVYKDVVNTDSFMVFDIPKKRLMELGKEFKQDSVIHSVANHHQCIYLQGEKNGLACVGDGWEELPADTQENYCLVNLKNGDKLKFRTHIDWLQECEPT
eukprot:CAMPEP_0201530810 /NCGR_PEP_ID=MMETSP0161_2-20130828/45751_1 /ASSEMBLY_ACC=CAM_ASM_000251 /TAXON_ID=180227 /ORGANISM="Neoparamoeba aestuarina, Strain SoJaBio B1-5/56/2" /LENGTH=158 /DNA_ID=CAMNT_0047933351 /DNA_START=127 /DNA_END=603 /DNA_ORIENTATION=-